MLKQLLVFVKAQLSAFVGGMCDYGIMILLTECAQIHYTASIAVSCILGAVVNFSLNKTWSFYSRNTAYKFSGTQQLIRFSFVVTSSILLKIAGTYMFTTYVGIDYKISRLITDILVSLCYNYVLQRFWVFIKTKNSER
ncbi:MAG: GtrA family protein [Prevotellaceae bacterium]|jgi:putative flippase GtrA|nr:GtrA family protein [Prevotellaceae bacterium]